MNEQIIESLIELRGHNNREWLQNNKSRYDALCEVLTDEVQGLTDCISSFDPEVVGLEARDCLFRTYRDIRFSSDKAPYKCRSVAYIFRDGRTSERGGCYIYLEPRGCLLSGGVWCPSPVLLRKLRQGTCDRIEKFMAIAEESISKKTFSVLEGKTLKRMPVSYPMDPPCGYIMKHKDLSVMSCEPDNLFYTMDWMDKVVDNFKLLLPFNRLLSYMVDGHLGRV